MTSSAEARAAAMDEEAHSRAGQVAQAALAESQLLVERIQGMRESVAAAEDVLAAIQAETSPRIQSAREALDRYLTGETETLGELESTAEEIYRTIHAHPTLSEAVAAPSEAQVGSALLQAWAAVSPDAAPRYETQ